MDKYKEALEKARAGKSIEEIFPELAESEDERIRKAIIRLLQNGGYMEPQDKEKAFAWLEKQPTNEEILKILQTEYEKGVADTIAKYDKIPIFRVGDTIIAKDGTCIPQEPFYIERIDDGFYWDGDNSILIGNQDEFQLMQKEQKDVLTERAQNIVANMLEDKIEGIQHDLIEFLSNAVNASWVDIIKSADCYAQRIRNVVQKEQKPAEWSEEEVGHLYTLARYIKSKGYEDDGEFLEGVANKLKRIRPQPKREWSEEDEKKLRTVISLMRASSAVDPFYDKMCLEGWLKSLRPQPHWKPSDK